MKKSTNSNGKFYLEDIQWIPAVDELWIRLILPSGTDGSVICTDGYFDPWIKGRVHHLKLTFENLKAADNEKR